MLPQKLFSVAMAGQGALTPVLGKTNLILLHGALTENIIFSKRLPRSTSNSKNIQDWEGCKNMIKIFKYLRNWRKKKKSVLLPCLQQMGWKVLAIAQKFLNSITKKSTGINGNKLLHHCRPLKLGQKPITEDWLTSEQRAGWYLLKTLPAPWFTSRQNTTKKK